MMLSMAMSNSFSYKSRALEVLNSGREILEVLNAVLFSLIVV